MKRFLRAPLVRMLALVSPGLGLAQHLLMATLLVGPCLATATQTSPPVKFEHGQGNYLESHRGKLYVEVEGSGPPLILVAGGPGSSHVIYHSGFSQVAAAGRSVIYFDNLGRGRSSRIANDQYTVASDIEDIESVRVGMGLEQFDLLGLSYGGVPALGYALRHPDRVRKLVMCDAEYDAQSWQKDTEQINACLKYQYPEVWDRLMALRAGGILSSAPDYASLFDKTTTGYYWFDISNITQRFYSNDVRDIFNRSVYTAIVGADSDWELGGALLSYTALPEVSKLKVPTLVAVGRHDRVVTPATAWRLKQALPAATSSWAVFERSGHHPFIEEPEAFFARLLEFLSAP
jgi:proline iminopeptidase